MILYDKKLTQLAQWSTATNAGTPTNNLYGDLQDISTITTISCYAYAEKKLFLNGTNEMVAGFLWNALLPVARVDVTEGDFLINIVDNAGLTILPKARISQIMVYRHQRGLGVKCVQVILEPN